METLARLALTGASFVVVGSLLMLAATKSHTPERTITVIALAGGLTALVVAGALIRYSNRRGRSPQEEK